MAESEQLTLMREERAARRGADIIRVHDVRETVQALKVQAAVQALD